MYFYLHSSLAGIDYEQNDDACIAIENILHAVRAGHHAAGGDLVTLRALRNLNGLSRGSYAVVDKLINWLPQQAAYFRTLSYGISVEAGDISVEPLNETRKWWRIPLRNCVSLDVLSSTVLLAENSHDCELFVHAANQYKKRKGISSLSVQRFPVGGGGSTTEDQFQDIANSKNSLCICVTDSDKFSPVSPKGKTAIACESVMSSTEWPAFHLSTSGRELENDIPHSFYWESLDGEPRVRWEKIYEAVNGFNRMDALSFFDLKEGVSVHWIISNNRSPLAFKYWSDLLANMVLPSQPKRCLDNKKCFYEKRKDDLCKECLVFPSVSRNVAVSVKEWLDQRSVQDAIQTVRRDDITFSGWLRIGGSVFECCLAVDKQRI